MLSFLADRERERMEGFFSTWWDEAALVLESSCLDHCCLRWLWPVTMPVGGHASPGMHTNSSHHDWIQTTFTKEGGGKIFIPVVCFGCLCTAVWGNSNEPYKIVAQIIMRRRLQAAITSPALTHNNYSIPELAALNCTVTECVYDMLCNYHQRSPYYRTSEISTRPFNLQQCATQLTVTRQRGGSDHMLALCFI